MTNDNQPRTGSSRRWIRRSALVAVGVAVAGVVGATAAQASPASTSSDSTITVDGAWRTLAPWASETVPSYTCPADHPYLTKEKYAPDFTTLPPGLEIFESPYYPDRMWRIGVSITGWDLTPDPTGVHTNLIRGTKSGPLDSSATNWSLDKAQYMVRLHCTSDPAEAGNR
ncbi:hypothetical protein [Pseudonocardia sp. GCM10023141]|uniref:hypothetical protein n=1 Tax=Pseudonocardia sp. GCM10023141 TaxID=3252653 RepID=UPI003610BAA8